MPLYITITTRTVPVVCPDLGNRGDAAAYGHFFPMFTLLEDLGYLPRVAFNLNKLFKKRMLTENRP